ncbi:unnamed protein product [Euphydryas editha]|uniref:DUF4806 domain-containing protein n=1 Tax=Euphydryas editha TaxID=104508 RepID=A0AAU9T981_EUPED|nr:unnamed protein product [Euphydryas editha]
MDTPSFVIVTFVNEDDAPGIVASNWINPHGNTCYYPNVHTEEMKNKLLKKRADPDESWPQYQIKVLKRYETYNEARLNLKKAEETSNLDSDDEVIKRKRKTKRVYSPDDSDSPDDYPTTKMKRTQPSVTYPIPPKRLLTGTRKNECTEKLTEVVATNSTVEMVQINVENLTPGHIQSKSQPNLTNSAPEYTFIRNTFFTGEVEDDIEISNVTNSTNTGPNRTINFPSGCILSKQFLIQQSHLIQVVTDLSVQMNEVNKKLDLLLARSSLQPINQREDTFTVPDFLINLPVKDDTSFCNLNEQLKNSHNKQSIMKFLAGIGGRNARSLTTNILRRILLDEVAELYSLTGKQMKNSNKKSFLTTETCKIIFQICKKIYDDVTDEHLNEITSDWLNQAKVRIRRRADRQNKASESETSGYNLGSNESF